MNEERVDCIYIVYMYKILKELVQIFYLKKQYLKRIGGMKQD